MSVEVTWFQLAGTRRRVASATPTCVPFVVPPLVSVPGGFCPPPPPFYNGAFSAVAWQLHWLAFRASTRRRARAESPVPDASTLNNLALFLSSFFSARKRERESERRAAVWENLRIPFSGASKKAKRESMRQKIQLPFCGARRRFWSWRHIWGRAPGRRPTHERCLVRCYSKIRGG